MPKISVIIPVYGVEQYIERCARSLFSQTLDDIEYLFIDDCTLDNSISILKRVLEDYPCRKSQVLIHRMKENSGQAAVRKWGMLNATGDFVIHCDSDDWVDCKMYETLYNKAIEDHSDLVICDYAISNGVDDKKIVTACHSSSKEQLIQNTLFQKDPWSLWNKLFKRKVCYNIEYPTGNMGEDMLLTLQIIINSHNFSYIPEAFYYYYSNLTSISKRKDYSAAISRFFQAKENVDKLIELFTKYGLIDKYKMEINYVKYTVLRLIQPLLRNKQCFKLWRDTYSGMGWQFIINPGASNKEKIKFILSCIKLYPLPHVAE